MVCLIIIIAIIVTIIMILPPLLYWNYIKIIKRNHKIKQEEYMKKHPNSYGIGELQL